MKKIFKKLFKRQKIILLNKLILKILNKMTKIFEINNSKRKITN